MKTKSQRLQSTIKKWLAFFIVSLVLSGITAFPLQYELNFLHSSSSFFPTFIKNWIDTIHIAITNTNNKYPQIAYGTDWLAFAHLVIAIFFIGVYINPIRNKFNLIAGMIACVAVLPLAFIAGPVREIPVFHQIIDCSFGVIGFIPLYICYKKINQLEEILKNEKPTLKMSKELSNYSINHVA